MIGDITLFCVWYMLGFFSCVILYEAGGDEMRFIVTRKCAACGRFLHDKVKGICRKVCSIFSR